MTIKVVLAFTTVYSDGYAYIYFKNVLFFLSQDTTGRLLWATVVLTVDGRMGPQTSLSLFFHWPYQSIMMALAESNTAVHWMKPSCSAVSDSSKFEAAETLTRQKKTSAYNYHNKTKTKSTVTVLLIVCFTAPNFCKICLSGSPKILLLGPISYGSWRIKTFLKAHLPALLFCQKQ